MQLFDIKLEFTFIVSIIQVSRNAHVVFPHPVKLTPRRKTLMKTQSREDSLETLKKWVNYPKLPAVKNAKNKKMRGWGSILHKIGINYHIYNTYI